MPVLRLPRHPHSRKARPKAVKPTEQQVDDLKAVQKLLVEGYRLEHLQGVKMWLIRKADGTVRTVKSGAPGLTCSCLANPKYECKHLKAVWVLEQLGL